MASNGRAVPRREHRTSGHATIRRRTIELIFQRYPGTDADAAIKGLVYEITVGESPPSKGITGADGKITIRLGAREAAQLKIMDTIFTIEAIDNIQPLSEFSGVQRRLRMLGYYSWNVDGIFGPRTERALLNFQADNQLEINGLCNDETKAKLREKVGE